MPIFERNINMRNVYNIRCPFTMTKYLLKEFLIKRSVLKSSISKRDNISKVYKNDKTLQNPETWGEKEMFRASSTSCF